MRVDLQRATQLLAVLLVLHSKHRVVRQLQGRVGCLVVERGCGVGCVLWGVVGRFGLVMCDGIVVELTRVELGWSRCIVLQGVA